MVKIGKYQTIEQGQEAEETNDTQKQQQQKQQQKKEGETSGRARDSSAPPQTLAVRENQGQQDMIGRDSPVIHTRAVVTSIIEKALVNLDVMAKIEVGDKLGWTASGHFVIQKPGYWTTAMRLVNRVDRWNTLSHIQDVVSTAETMENVHDGDRLRLALQRAIHGVRNLQMTYEGDVLMTSSLTVLLQRLGARYGLEETELM